MSASAGTVIAAALETSGYKGQSLVLEQLWALLSSTAFLFFVASAVIALSAWVFTGGEAFEPKKFLWFLIGPVLYLFVTGNTVQSSGAEWQFGDFEGKQEIVDKAIGGKVNAEVSWFFDQYNRLISSIVQNTIAIFSSNEIRQQMIFMNREKVLDKMFNAEIGNPGLLALIHTGLKGQCGRFMEASRAVALGNRDPQYQVTAEFKDAQAAYNDLFAKKSVSLGANDILHNYLETLLTAVGRAGKSEEFITRYCDPTTEGGNKLSEDFKKPASEVLSQPLSCQQLWCWTAMGVNSEVEEIKRREAERIKKQSVAQSVPASETEAVLKEMWLNIAVKMSPPDPNVPLLPGETRNRSEPDPSVIPVVVGGMLLKKEMMRDPRSIQTSRFAEHAGVYTAPTNFSMEMNRYELQDVLRKHNMAQQVVALQYETYIFAMTIPYLQGFLLYALGVLFPFFALYLILPGHTENFFTWLGLWAWVKSWDAGFALVMAVDEILWHMMPHSAWIDPTIDPNHSPVSFMEAAFSSDPSYSLGTYYMIVGVMLTAVPSITGHMVLGSKRAIAGVLTKGLQHLGETLGGSAADYTAAQQIAKIDYLRHMADIGYVRNQVNGMRMGWSGGDKKYQELVKAGKNDEASKYAIDWISNKVQQVAGAGAAGTIRSALTDLKPAQLGWVMYDMTTGAQMRQSVNRQRALYTSLSGNKHLFDANRLSASQSMNALRAGLSNRGEFWNRWDAPIDLAGSDRLFTQVGENNVTEAQFQAAGAVADSIRRIFLGVR